MDSFSGDPLTEEYWQMTVETLNPILSSPSEGLLKIDLTLVLTSVQIDSLGNLIRRSSEAQWDLTLALPGTMSRTQYSSAINHWLHCHLTLEADVATGFTDAVIEYVFQHYVNIHGNIQVHVAAELEYVATYEAEMMDQVEEDDNKGLCTHCINILRDEYVYLAAAAEGDCSICLQKLVSAGGDKKKKNNYLFESPCRHVFHDECMAEWLRNSDSCPLCRYVVSSEVIASCVDMN